VLNKGILRGEFAFWSRQIPTFPYWVCRGLTLIGALLSISWPGGRDRLGIKIISVQASKVKCCVCACTRASVCKA